MHLQCLDKKTAWYHFNVQSRVAVSCLRSFINVIFSTQHLKEENRLARSDVCQQLPLLYSIWETAVEDSASEVTACETRLLLFFNEKGEQLWKQGNQSVWL